MKFSSSPWLLRLAATLLFTTFVQAAEEPDPSLKLREQLRAVTLQLRTAQTESANSQAIAAASDQKSKDLSIKIEDLEKRNVTLLKQANTDKASAAGSIEILEKKVTDREKLIVQYKQAFEKAKAAYQKADGTATAKEGERAQLAAELVTAKRTIADRERKNLGLFNVANEILNRYQSYSLGKALSAREPFVGTTRVKIENLVQGYQDKILDNRIAAKKP
jgi:chromosome segregation ATPase